MLQRLLLQPLAHGRWRNLVGVRVWVPAAVVKGAGDRRLHRLTTSWQRGRRVGSGVAAGRLGPSGTPSSGSDAWGGRMGATRLSDPARC